MTNGAFSIQIDGTTRTSIDASSAGTFSCATPPSHSTPRPLQQRAHEASVAVVAMVGREVAGDRQRDAVWRQAGNGFEQHVRRFRRHEAADESQAKPVRRLARQPGKRPDIDPLLLNEHS